MKKIFLLILTFFIMFLGVTAQRPQAKTTRILLNKQEPAVFVSFIEQKAIKDSDRPKGRNYLFFKITNNTRWKIWLDMSGVAGKEFGDASLYYAIENPKTDENVSGSVICHVCSTNPLNPGRSIIFSLPAKDATIDARMRLIYRFDWEDDLIQNNTHSVEYFFSNLPKNTLNQ